MACKNIAGRWMTILVDCKLSREDTPHYDVEVASLDAVEIFSETFLLPTYYVYNDGQVVQAHTIRQHGKPGTWRGRGSGTDFLIFDKTVCKPFNKAFGVEVFA
jgi:hypothetical protein